MPFLRLGTRGPPLALAQAHLVCDRLSFPGEFIDLSGRKHVAVRRSALPQKAAGMGADAGAEVVARAGADLLGARG